MAKSSHMRRRLSPQQQARLANQRRAIAKELPELTRRNQMQREAASEPTVSGELRRAIHLSRLSLADIATKAGITAVVLDDFLTGERTLRSDVIDRLAACVDLAVSCRA